MTSDDLRRDLEASRRAISRDYTALRAELDFVTKAKQSVVRNPLPWLGGSAFVGWLLAGRKKSRAGRSRPGEAAPVKKLTALSLLLALAKLLLPVARPFVTNFAIGKLADYAAKRGR